MRKYSYVLILVILLIGIANAQTGLLAGGPLYGSGPADKMVPPDPRLDDWGLRDVTWTQMPDALYPFHLQSSGVLGNYLYAFNEVSSTGQAFNLTTELWEESTPGEVRRWDQAGVATADAIYLIGGYYNGNLADVEKFVPTGGGPTGTWTPVANYPVGTRGVAAAWDRGNYIYASGGFTDQGQTSAAFRYDIAQDAWAPIASMPNVMGFAGGAFVLGKFYAMGGFGDHSLVQEYNPASNTWTQRADIPEGIVLAQTCTTSNDSLIFIVGGGWEFEGYPPSDAVQMYDPLTDAWYWETPLPRAVSANCAHWVGGGEIISAGGWSPGVGPHGKTYRGTGFPSGSPSAGLSVTLVPFVQPIEIPAGGGSFDFYLFLTNSRTTPQQVDVWTMEVDPYGFVLGPELGPARVTIPPGPCGWVRHQNVPAGYQSGLYTYIGNVGICGNCTWAADSIQFTKLAAGDESGGALTEPISSRIAPNPFNPTTAISFELRAASYVSLKIYDTAGRLVTELVNGWRDAGEHQMTFDGSGLPSGIYFAKLTVADPLGTGEVSQVQKLILLK